MNSIVSSRISSKGQVVIPKEVRDEQHWSEGTEVIFITTPQGLLIKPKSPFPKTNIEDYLARQKPYVGQPIPESEWDDRMIEAMRKEWK